MKSSIQTFLVLATLCFYQPGWAQGVPFAFIRSAPATTVTYVGNSISATDSNTYTFSSLSLGNPAPNRSILVGFVSRSASTFTATSMTVDGVTATILYQQQSAGSVSGFALARVPSNTTGNVVVTFGGTMVTAGVAVWVVGNLQATTPFASTTWTTTKTGTLNVPARGVAVGICYNSTSALTWSAGLTSDFARTQTDNVVRNFTGGSYTSSSAVNPLTTTVTGTTNVPICTVISLK